MKTLHRNLLLPFSAIPRTSQVEDILPSKPVKPRTRPGKATPKPVIQISESQNSSDSEQDEVSISRYVLPCRRRPSGTPDRSHATNISGGSTSRSQDHTEASNMTRITSNYPGPSFRRSLPPTSRVVVLLVLQIVLVILVGVYLLWTLLSHVVPDGTDRYPNASAIGYINRVFIIKTQLSILCNFNIWCILFPIQQGRMSYSFFPATVFKVEYNILSETV